MLCQIVSQSVKKSWQQRCSHIRIFFWNRIHDLDCVVNLIRFRIVELFQFLLIHEAVIYNLRHSVGNQGIADIEENFLLIWDAALLNSAPWGLIRNIRIPVYSCHFFCQIRHSFKIKPEIRNSDCKRSFRFLDIEMKAGQDIDDSFSRNFNADIFIDFSYRCNDDLRLSFDRIFINHSGCNLAGSLFQKLADSINGHFRSCRVDSLFVTAGRFRTKAQAAWSTSYGCAVENSCFQEDVLRRFRNFGIQSSHDTGDACSRIASISNNKIGRG